MGKRVAAAVYAGRAAIRYTRSLTRIPVRTSPRSYEVLVERGLLRSASASLLALVPPHSKAFLVSSEPILKLWGSTLQESFASANRPLAVIEMADGETSKRLDAVAKLAERMVG